MKFGDRVVIKDPFYSNYNLGYIVGKTDDMLWHPNRDGYATVYKVKLASDLLNEPICFPEYVLEKSELCF